MKKSTSVINNPKKLLYLTFMSLPLLFSSCSDDDDAPAVVIEEEVITTMTVTLAGSETITLQTRDLDGDGPDDPVITVSGNLTANTIYSGTISLQNETVTPIENITEEVEEKDEEHQFFFSADGALTEVSYTDEDGDGNPLGLTFELTTGDAGSGTLQITLRHEPKKPNDGTLSDAGGETDIAQTFTITVE